MLASGHRGRPPSISGAARRDRLRRRADRTWATRAADPAEGAMAAAAHPAVTAVPLLRARGRGPVAAGAADHGRHLAADGVRLAHLHVGVLDTDLRHESPTGGDARSGP